MVLDADVLDAPIVLVHGYMDANTTPWWDRIEGYLDDFGFDIDKITVADLGDVPGTTVGSPKEYAGRVERAVERLYDRYGRVNVLAHSMGGIDARWYVEEMDGADKVGNLVTLGTPHRGTYAAYLGYFSRGGRALAPSSDLVTSLNAGGPAEGVQYSSLWGKADALVVPSHHGRLPWSGADNVTNVGVGLYGHLSLIFRRNLIRKALRVMRP